MSRNSSGELGTLPYNPKNNFNCVDRARAPVSLLNVIDKNGMNKIADFTGNIDNDSTENMNNSSCVMNENENFNGRGTPKSACYNLENNYIDNNNDDSNNNDNISDDNNDSGKNNLSSKDKRDRKDEIDLDSVGDRLVVSFRGSVLANVLTDLKFDNLSQRMTVICQSDECNLSQ